MNTMATKELERSLALLSNKEVTLLIEKAYVDHEASRSIDMFFKTIKMGRKYGFRLINMMGQNRSYKSEINQAAQLIINITQIWPLFLVPDELEFSDNSQLQNDARLLLINTQPIEEILSCIA